MEAADIEKLKRPQLQQLCKKFGLRAAGKNTALIESLKAHVVQLTLTQASPKKSPRTSPAKRQPSSNVPASPTPVVSPPNKAPVAKRGGKRGRPARKPAAAASPVQTVRDVESVDIASPVVVENVGKRGRGRKAKAATSKQAARESLPDKASAEVKSLDVRPTKRKRSEVESTPPPSAKRSRQASSSASSPALSGGSRASTASCRQLVLAVPRFSDTSTGSQPSSATSRRESRRQAAVSASASPACSIIKPVRKGRTSSTSSTRTPVAAISTDDNTKTQAEASPTKSTKRSSSSLGRSPVLMLARQSRKPSPSSEVVAQSLPSVRGRSTPPATAKLSPGRKTSASKSNSGMKSAAASRRGSATKSPNVASPIGSGIDSWREATDLSPSPTSTSSSRRETFVVAPPATARVKTSPGGRRSSKSHAGVTESPSKTVSPGARRSGRGSGAGTLPVSSSPGLSVDDMKAAIMADLNQRVSSKLPAAPSTKIPRLGSLTALGGAGQSKAPASGKNWSQIHNKNFSRMKSIEDEVRLRNERKEKLAASRTPRVAMLSRTPKVSLSKKPKSPKVSKPAIASSKPDPKPVAKSIPKPSTVFQPSKKLSFNFGGKPPSVAKPAPSRLPSLKASSSAMSIAASSSTRTSTTVGFQSSAASTSMLPTTASSKTPVKASATEKRKSVATPHFSFASPGFKSPAAPKPKFDLKSSLQRPLTYVPHRGPIRRPAGTGNLTSGSGPKPKPRTQASMLKSPRVTVLRQAGSPPKDFKKPPVRDFRAANRNNLVQRNKDQRLAATMANRGL